MDAWQIKPHKYIRSNSGAIQFKKSSTIQTLGNWVKLVRPWKHKCIYIYLGLFPGGHNRIINHAHPSKKDLHKLNECT